MWTDRTEILIGCDGVNRLERANVAVVGLGGVGGSACELLARAGVGNLTIVDFDKVDETNINRQVVAFVDTVGRLKTQVMKEMILKINPNCNVVVKNMKVSSENLSQVLDSQFDYVIDAIDSVQDKIDLICYCKSHEINIVSAMGAGNRLELAPFKVVDIFKTSNDPLAKVVRKKLRERDIKSLDVAICEQPARPSATIGSVSYFPVMCGCTLCAYVIKKILGGD